MRWHEASNRVESVARRAGGKGINVARVLHQLDEEAAIVGYLGGVTGAAARDEHLKDVEDFVAALGTGTLPAVSLVKPIGAKNEHLGYATLLEGQEYVAELVNRVQESPVWKDSVIIITYDESGGRWDHVPPPKVDRWGPGLRVPAIIISPFAKRGFVDHTNYETTSILKLIETRWGLPPLTSRDAAANDLLNTFEFSERR